MNKDLPPVLIPRENIAMTNVDIHTEILEPVSATQTRLLFNIKKQGVLSSGGRLVLSVHNDDATANGTCFLTPTAGVGGLIEKATIRAGTTILATTEEVSDRYMIDKAVHTSSMRANIDMVLDGAAGSNVSASPNTDGVLSVDVNSASYTSATTCVTPDRYRPVNSQTACPLYSIGLDDLWPGLKNLNLPVGFMNEQVSIEILLRQQTNPQTGRTIMFDSAPTSTSTRYGIENCVLHLDYLTYDAETMNRIQAEVDSDRGMPMTYSDVLVTKSQLPGVAQPATGQVTKVDFTRQVGSSGMRVNNVIVTERANDVNVISGIHRSQSPVHTPSYNWRFNSIIKYPRALTNPCLMRNELENVQRFPMSVHNAEYSHDIANDLFTSNDGGQNNPFDADVTFNSKPVNQLLGNYFIHSLNLRRGVNGLGTMIANKNILYERTNTFSRNDFGTRLIKFFVDYDKTFTLRNGIVFTSM
jgi:hypothetical protein